MRRAVHSILMASLVCSLVVAAPAAVRVYRASPGTATKLADLPADQTMTDFTDAAGKPAAAQTLATAFVSGGNLVFLVECLEPQSQRLVAKCQQDDEGAG